MLPLLPVLALWLGGCDCKSVISSQPTTGSLRLGGSTTVFPLAKATAEAFTRSHPEVSFDIRQSSTGDGLRAFIEGELDIADATRPPLEQEIALAAGKGKNLYLTVIAYDAVAVLVNAQNPITNLKVRELKGIFFGGETTDWAQLVPGTKSRAIHVYHTSSVDSGTAELFNHRVIGQQPAIYVPGSVEIHRTPEVVTRVRQDQDAIAYSPLKWAGPGVKVLPIDGVEPTEQTCLDGTYPFARKLLFVTDGPPTGAVRDYVSFVLGITSQQTIVRQQGFIPIF